jgi:hypothetical protein
MILDPQNALFKDDWLIHHEVPEDMIEQVSIGVDPSGGEDEVGIVAAPPERRPVCSPRRPQHYGRSRAMGRGGG